MTEETALTCQEPDQPGVLIPLLFTLILLGAGLFLFWPLLFSGHQLAYRDASYLYYPLFSYIQTLWESGQIPLWNPHCNLGQPLLADGTSSVFYPGKLIFFAGFLPFATRFGMYVMLHVLLGGVGTYRCGRAMGISQLGSSTAGLAFAFGAPFLSQVNNVVFLVGGAWLPWSILCLWLLAHRSSGRWQLAVWLGLIWSMMILGGDPQMVYHGLIIAMILYLVQSIGRSSHSDNPDDESASSFFDRLRINFQWLKFVPVAMVITALLSAVQILPSAEASNQSWRSEFYYPRTIYEIPQSLQNPNSGWRGVGRGFFGPPGLEPADATNFGIEPFWISELVQSHQSDLYQFSLPPWTLCETAVPNINGTSYPFHRRWIDQLSGVSENNRRSWYPSLYFGIGTILLALAAVRLRTRRDPHVAPAVTLTWISIFFCLGSFGVFGVGMVMNTLWSSVLEGGAANSDFKVGPQVGGVYWLMNVGLPGYVMFRYPAKLFLVSCFALVLLAGLGLDGLIKQGTRRRFTALLFAIPITAGMLLIFTWLPGLSIGRRLSAITPDEILGPFDAAGTMFEIRCGLIQSAIVAISLGWLLRGLRNHRLLIVPGFICLFVLDLLVANRWIVATHPPLDYTAARQKISRGPEYQRFYWWKYEWDRNPEEFGTHSPMNYLHRFKAMVPEKWSETASAARLAEFAQWQVDTLQPKTHLWVGANRLDSFSSIERVDWLLMASSHSRWSDAWSGDLYSLWYDQIQPVSAKCWIASRVRPVLPELKSSSIFDLYGRTGQIRDEATDQKSAVVETNFWEDSYGELPSSGTVELTGLSAHRISFSLNLDSPGLVVVNDQYDRGWRARYSSDGGNTWTNTPIYRTNRIMRGVVLPEGRQQLVMEYRPTSFVVGAIVSTLSWFVLLVLGGRIASIQIRPMFRRGAAARNYDSAVNTVL